MEYALVDGERREAAPKQAGTCPVCGSRMIPKCGTKVLWHWAHQGRKHCDPWWENETEWHRAWKSCFPDQWREQVHFDATGEKHVADVKTPSGIVLEFQNSPMPSAELAAREHFYGNMLWIVNGLPFREHFFVLARLPSPDIAWASDVVFNAHSGRTFWRRSENPGYQPGQLVEIHSMYEIREQIDRDYVGHHLYDWLRPRSVWFESKVPVYIDFGGDLLWHLQQYGPDGLPCVQATKKATLVSLHGGAYTETGEIAQAAKRPIRNGSPLGWGETDVILGAIR